MKFFLSKRKITLFTIVIIIIFCGTLIEIKSFTNEFNARHWGEVNGCHLDLPLNQRNFKACTHPGKQKSRAILLFGDSNAEQFSEALIEVSKKSDRKLIIETISGCPFLPGYVSAPTQYKWPTGKPRACQDYFESVLSYLRNSKPADVVLAFSDQYFREPGWVLGENKLLASTTTTSRYEFLSRGLEQTIGKILSYGHRILFIVTIPQLNYKLSKNDFVVSPYSPTLCSIKSLILMQCDRSLTVKDYNKVQVPIKVIEIQVLKKLKVEFLDFKESICRNEKCVNRRGLSWIYRDGAHISKGQSLKLADSFRKMLNHV
jgi:hypothetical protein